MEFDAMHRTIPLPNEFSAFPILILTLFVSCCTCAETSATSCAPSPISLPVTNVHLPNGASIRGIQMGIGNPPQQFSFMPEMPQNNTIIFDSQGQCSSDATQNWCMTRRGGEYIQGDSSTYAAASDVFAAGGDPYDTSPNATSSLWITENITLSLSAMLGKFPLGIARADVGGDYHTQMELGLGINSTIISALKSAGHIASRSWSMFWGLQGATAATQMDGGFVFGGFDQAKVTGRNYTAPLSTNRASCGTGMVVGITDIQVNWPNGSNPSLFHPGDQAILACVVPSFPTLLTIHNNPWYERFSNITGGTYIGRSSGINFWGMLYDVNDVFNGDMTFVLDSGLSVRIPNDQLVIPELTINSDPNLNSDGFVVANNSNREILINAIEDDGATGMTLLGRQFLSHAYVLHNEDAGTFTLWNAKATAAQDLVAVDDANNIISTSCNSSSTPSAQPSARPRESNSRHSLSAGAIAGIAIGSVALLAGIATAAFLLCIQRTRSRRSAGTHEPVMYQQYDPKSGMMSPSTQQHSPGVEGHFSSQQNRFSNFTGQEYSSVPSTDGTVPSYLNSPNMRHEMPSPTPPQELEAENPVGWGR